MEYLHTKPIKLSFMAKLRQTLTKALLGAAATLIVAEIGVRAIGLTDFPLYEASKDIGYIPQANQQGRFLNKNEWAFNNEHMGSGPFQPSDAVDTLLIGDSIVLGGNPFTTAERLGPRLQALIGGKVWPISAGSWALRNELTYLRAHKDVVAQVDRLVFVLNSGDFGEASSWSCELTHPLSRPIFSTYYLAQRYGTSVDKCGTTPAELQVPPGDAFQELAAFLRGTGKQVIVFLYPDKAELISQTQLQEKLTHHIPALRQAGVQHIFLVSDDSRWTPSAYKDTIHPSVQATQTLASIMADKLQQTPLTH